MPPSIKEFIKRLIPRFMLIRRLGPQAESSKSVLLTFDDGPDPDTTPKVLDLLDHYHAKAIFFVVGRCISKAPDMLTTILQRGHEVANHTFIHNHHEPPPFRTYLKDVVRCRDAIFSLTGSRTRYFRPPSGHLSPASLMVPILLRLRLMNWSLGVRDWNCHTRREASDAAHAILARVQARDIILLHDDNPRIVDILEIILPELRSQGYDLARGLDLI